MDGGEVVVPNVFYLVLHFACPLQIKLLLVKYIFDRAALLLT